MILDALTHEEKLVVERALAQHQLVKEEQRIKAMWGGPDMTQADVQCVLAGFAEAHKIVEWLDLIVPKIRQARASMSQVKHRGAEWLDRLLEDAEVLVDVAADGLGRGMAYQEMHEFEAQLKVELRREERA